MNPLLNKAAAYCAAAEHCRSEVQTKLLQWGASAGQAGDILDQLEDQGFISESRYCAAFVNDKIRFQGWGKEKIRMALKQKRLPNSKRPLMLSRRKSMKNGCMPSLLAKQPPYPIPIPIFVKPNWLAFSPHVVSHIPTQLMPSLPSSIYKNGSATI